MITVRARSAVIAAFALVLVCGCSREQQDWRSAESTDTVEAYDQFIQKHPESELTTQARARVAQLGEERDWQRAGSADNVEAYRQFLADHPNGKWAQEARIRIENFSLSEQAGVVAPSKGAPASAVSTGSAGAGAQQVPGSAAPAAVQPPSAGAPLKGSSAAGPPPAKPQGLPQSSGYAVQLGAFKNEAGAQAEWQALKARYGTDLGALQQKVVAADGPSGRIYRLQAGVPDEAHARALCDSLKKRSQPCVAVLPH